MDPLKKFWFWATTYVPRGLPTNENDWRALKLALKYYYNVPDSPEVWATVAGHVSSTPTHSKRRSYGYLATIAHRLQINNAAKLERESHREALEAKLKSRMEAFAKDYAAKNPETGSTPEVSDVTNETPQLSGQNSQVNA